jgi:hypothetical protein
MPDDRISQIEAHMEMVTRRMLDRIRGLPRDQSNQIDFGDRCYLMGLGYSVGKFTGEDKDTVVSRIRDKVLAETPSTKTKVVRRRSTEAATSSTKRKVVRRKK